MSSSASSSRAHAQTPGDGRRASPAVHALRTLVDSDAAHPAAFDAVADEHAELWAPATVLAALARIARGDGNADAADQLRHVADRAADTDPAEVLDHLPVTTRVRVTRVALSSASHRDSDVLVLTHGVEPVDDVTALLVVYRATALARVGMATAAQSSFRLVLRLRRLHHAVRTFARRQRDAALSDLRATPSREGP